MTTNAIDRLTGENVRKFRQAISLSQAALAEQLSARGFPFSQQTLLKVEKGDRPLRFSEAVVMAELLGVQISDLHEGDSEKSDEAAALRRALGLCSEIDAVANATAARLGKLANMLAVLRRFVTEQQAMHPRIADDSRVRAYLEASLVDVLRLARARAREQYVSAEDLPSSELEDVAHV